MKTTFSRFFALFAAVILLCVMILGVAFRVMLSDFLEEESREALHENAEALVSLASAYDASGELGQRWSDFHIALTSAARVADADIVLTDKAGEIWLCSCPDTGCIHTNSVVPIDIIGQILADGESFLQDDLGLYSEDQYVEGMTIDSQVTGETVGILLVMASSALTRDMLMQSTVIFFYVAILVLVLAMAASFFLSRSQARSIQTVASAATRFGRGELDARVAVGGRNTVEVDELAMAFNAMAESLAQSERQRQEFVANVSHELKTPMTTIAGFMDGMLDGTIPQSQHRRYMQLVSDEVRRLSRLVRSMLEISRLQSQGISEDKKRRFDLCESIGQVLISFERRINAKRIYMDVQLPDRSAWTKADPDSITQVIYNLTDNAIKFCNEGGRLSVWLSQEGSKYRVGIQNTGGTVPAEELPLLFDRFHKADKSRSADREGVGLGLYIVKTILGSHGEDIAVTSQDGVTTFVFTLPAIR